MMIMMIHDELMMVMMIVMTITELKAWGTKTLEGFLDVSDVGTKTLDASIVLYYNNRTSSESVELSVELGYDYSNLFFVFGILIVVGLIVWRVVVFVKRVKKHRRK